MKFNPPYNRIMFAGPSGIGKTTLAKYVSNMLGIPFISGSMSDLIPSTKDTLHVDILNKSPKDLYEEDYALINLRNKSFKELHSFVTDRSYLDSAAYFIYKQSKHQPQCEIDQFLGICQRLLVEQCDLLILVNMLPNKKVMEHWSVEDNNKRIVNTYFQMEISSLMYSTLKLMGFIGRQVDWYESGNILDIFNTTNKFTGEHNKLEFGIEEGVISNNEGIIDALVINEIDFNIRNNILNTLLK